MAFSLHLNKKVYMSKWPVNFQSLSKLANDNIDIGIMAQSIPSVNNPRGICHLFFWKNCKCPKVGPAGSYRYSAVRVLYFRFVVFHISGYFITS